MRNSFLLRLMAGLFAFAIVGSACASDSGSTADNTAAEDTTDADEMGDGATDVDGDTGAPALAAGLTDLLDSHVYLAAIAGEQAVITKSTDSPQFKAAAGALDTNSIDLSKAIGSVYGPDTEKAFLEQWRAHICTTDACRQLDRGHQLGRRRQG